MIFCPHCNSDLYLKLTFQYVAEVDESVKSVNKKAMAQMPSSFQRFAETLSFEDEEHHYAIPVYILSSSIISRTYRPLLRAFGTFSLFRSLGVTGKKFPSPKPTNHLI
ncbi:MAG: hypothetical protein INQ03_19055 [Candidatus Heimdallarchaeota archaeon]|nr:hypothetical protein [Candidatus Heimdallarchaeota archaeon]